MNTQIKMKSSVFCTFKCIVNVTLFSLSMENDLQQVICNSCEVQSASRKIYIWHCCILCTSILIFIMLGNKIVSRFLRNACVAKWNIALCDIFARKCDYWTDIIDRQTPDKVIPICQVMLHQLVDTKSYCLRLLLHCNDNFMQHSLQNFCKSVVRHTPVSFIEDVKQSLF